MQAVLLSFIWIWGAALSAVSGKQSVVNNCPERLDKLPHPFHVSVIEVNHNVSAATLEVQCKIYTDDFEAVLSKMYKRKIDLTDKTMHTAMDSLVERYVLSHLLVKANGKLLTENYLGFEQDKEAVYVFVELSQAPALIKEVEVNTHLLYEQYEDQINIIHFSSGEKKKSIKLDNPDTRALLVL